MSEVWVGQCPHCGRSSVLILGFKRKQDEPVRLYCPECREFCSIPEVIFVRQ